MTIVGDPKIDTRPERPYLGIRVQVPMRGLAGALDPLFKELTGWFEQRGLAPTGPPFLRYHVIDMAGTMDIESGIPVAVPSSGDERVQPGTLPGGRFASLIYSGNGVEGNKALLEWGAANGLVFDRWNDPHGDAFRARYETFLTDPRVEPRKTKWKIEVAIKVRDEAERTK